MSSAEDGPQSGGLEKHRGMRPVRSHQKVQNDPVLISN